MKQEISKRKRIKRREQLPRIMTTPALDPKDLHQLVMRGVDLHYRLETNQDETTRQEFQNVKQQLSIQARTFYNGMGNLIRNSRLPLDTFTRALANQVFLYDQEK